MSNAQVEIYVLIEQREGELLKPSLEVLGEALDMAELAEGGQPHVTAVVFSGQWSVVSGQLTAELARYGAHQIIVAQSEMLQHFDAAVWAEALQNVINSSVVSGQWSVVMVAGTPNGRELAPRLAVMLGAGLVADSVRARLAQNGNSVEIVATTPLYGDRVYSQRHNIVGGSSTPDKAVVSFRAGSRGVDKPGERGYATSEIVELPLELTTKGVEHVRFVPADPRTVHLTEAEVVVCGGAGVGKESFGMMWDLAGELKAAVGGTRVAVDKGWLEWDRQIGQTGQIVAPRLFVSCGSSGASQHITGMKDSRTVIVINADRNAPMFSLADIGVVGDVHEIVPKLMEKLKGAKRV